jgi:tetratricopeptide (TPR) repeat protein
MGNAPMSVPGGPGSMDNGAQSPQIQAKVLYNTGVRDVRKADNFETSAATLSDATKKTKALGEARTLYSTALGKFQRAVQLDPRMHEGWNYVGYTHRKLGDFEDALAAYERALALHPGFPEAIEYRGEAYLAVNKIADAQQSYLDLFAVNRAMAGKLLDAMKSWIAAQRSASTAADPTAVNELDRWVQERAQIAAQTASLTREGTAASWR